MENFSQADHPEEPPEAPGYVVGRQLGRGGSASVWLATDGQTREYALKCFTPGEDRPDTATAEDAVRREIRIMSVLDHQHLVKSHQVVRLSGAADGRLGLVMDYAPGGSLAQLLATRGKLGIGETVTVLTPIAQVLAYLHSQGFTHSDVSPGNVLFTGHGKPLLADVGVARMVGDAMPVSDHGTVGFMDPSPVDAVRAGIQPERDVYSVAALGWYCLTGRIPGLAADRPPLSLLVPEVPAELGAALEAGLSEDRRLRPSATELATAIYRSASPEAVDLSGSVHPTVMPELLTRRHTPPRAAGREKLRGWGRRIVTSRLPGLFRSRPPGSGSAHSHGHSHGAPGTRIVPPAHVGVRRRALRAAAARPPRNGKAGTMVAAALGIALVAVWWMTGQPSPETVFSTPAAATGSDALQREADGDVPAAVRRQLLSADPGEAAQGLAWLRSTAFSSGRLDLLDEVNVRDSPAASADLKISSRLRESGHVLAGFTTTLAGMETRPESTAERTVVGVTSSTSAYEEKNAAGTVVATGPAAAVQGLRLVLAPVDGVWRIVEILPAH
ncbi:protein kinase domain-containing protein [Pseudarthrobacter sp. N5]|uniref:protein kinase domain-containing protein n=1 Tax=Pseudarthrobacter sp. N5 TaxID=3418416 RepID=UPI003CEF7986